jgi:hypothetical protein
MRCASVRGRARSKQAGSKRTTPRASGAAARPERVGLGVADDARLLGALVSSTSGPPALVVVRDAARSGGASRPQLTGRPRACDGEGSTAP